MFQQRLLQLTPVLLLLLQLTTAAAAAVAAPALAAAALWAHLETLLASHVPYVSNDEASHDHQLLLLLPYHCQHWHLTAYAQACHEPQLPEPYHP
jgi:hypothetical protein